MARKLKQPAAPGDKPLMDAICSSAHQIWQAGLGAFSKAQDQGEDLFSPLVKEGASVQQRLRSSAGDMAGAMPARRRYQSPSRMRSSRSARRPYGG